MKMNDKLFLIYNCLKYWCIYTTISDICRIQTIHQYDEISINEQKQTLNSY